MTRWSVLRHIHRRARFVKIKGEIERETDRLIRLRSNFVFTNLVGGCQGDKYRDSPNKAESIQPSTSLRQRASLSLFLSFFLSSSSSFFSFFWSETTIFFATRDRKCKKKKKKKKTSEGHRRGNGANEKERIGNYLWIVWKSSKESAARTSEPSGKSTMKPVGAKLYRVARSKIPRGFCFVNPPLRRRTRERSLYRRGCAPRRLEESPRRHDWNYSYPSYTRKHGSAQRRFWTSNMLQSNYKCKRHIFLMCSFARFRIETTPWSSMHFAILHLNFSKI